ncbi:regulator of G-protein signaling loco-like [Argiope bruennichi]|uniref:Regulator of G-protein signaling 12 like protein n=1 Tax=Argiope bruennichi TaxID=94029 RepID=A0A8T0F5F9_ARGBR|nr:regulator of G-protein signaling loco-like [Argiope bruennichi]KAF8785505.1 Regulator of G-protein signaling 12 like protein [Argiope bruennichi]
MHQHRRRKKRPSYGVRTVEISRGKNGFGFTISGQAPCILSCIITGSPAEKAGLRPGDFLIAVNGQNVSKAPHDDVVRLIGNSNGILKLQIAENYYSDSSEEEFISIVKLRPKYPNKIRNRHQNSVSRAEKVVQDLQTGALFVDHIHGSNVIVPQKQSSKSHTAGLAGPSRSNKVLLDLILQQRLQDGNNRHSLQSPLLQQTTGIASVSSNEKSKQVPSKRKENQVLKSRSHPEHLNTSSSSTSEVFHSIFTEQDLNNILYPAIFASQNVEQKGSQEQAILKAVVGYLGTIEMPKEPQLPNSRLQTIRNCIRRLRVEKKVHTLVLMSVFSESIILINPQGVTLAEFSADKITFSGVYSDDKKFFGLVTNHGRNIDEFSESSQEEPGSVSSSCHVFMVDPKLIPHHQHLKRAKAFHITCTSDPVTNKCKEFPESADSILQAVVGLYRSKLGPNNDVVHGLEFHVNMSPQPSNTSSNSSNSDSGIGFRDEGNASDRVFVVDVDNYHQYSTNSLDRQAFSNPGFGLLESPLRAFSISQDNQLLASKSMTHSQSTELKNINNKASPCHFDRLTVRAMPDPVGFERNCSNYNSELLEQPNSSRNSLHNLIQMREDSPGNFKSGQNLNQLGSCADDNSIVDNQNGASSVESHVNKLSPKVYGLNFPLKSVDEIGFCNTSVESAGWECTSCSTEELQVPTRHLMLQEAQDTTEQEEDGSQDVHPPTQEEDSESEISGVEQGSESTSKWARTSSLRRHLGRKRSLYRSTHEAGTVSDGELASGKASTSSSMLALDRMSDTSHRSSCASERPIDVGRVGSWAAGFNVLLEDPAGLHTFSEFLKKEFSQENITFWIACERYRQLKDQSAMAQMAKEIYNKHLCIGAHEPVNVDSHARQVAQEGLESPTPDLFLPAQKQIFNLMKFDCYQRFLKSTMFKECMLREMQGQPLLYQGQSNDAVFGNEKQKMCSELKKRKSLIPWHKLSKAKSNESKSGGSRLWDRHCEIRKSLKKKKKEKDSHKLDDASSTQSDMTDSRSSLTSSETGVIFKNVSSRESLNSAELTLFPNHCGSEGYYCRVILPDLSTTVVRTQKGETVGEMLLKLLERRSLSYNAVEAYIVGSHQPLDHCTDVTSLSCKEIRVEQVILFCVELPNRKTIGVKAKNNKICGDILKPVLHKYGYKMECVTMSVAALKKPVSKNAPITSIDNQRIIVEMKDSFSSVDDPCSTDKSKASGNDPRDAHSFPDLEELTNQIFDDLLKTRPGFQYDGLGIVDLERKDRIKNTSKSSSFFHQTCSEKDIDILPSKYKSLTGPKSEGTKLLAENKPLLPHNPLRSKSNYDGLNAAVLSSVKDSNSSSAKFENNSNDFSHGKENFPVPNKTEMKINNPFNNVDVEYGLATALQRMDPGFTSDLIYSTTKLAEKYFPRQCYSSATDFEETNSENILQNLGIIPSDMKDLKSRHAQWSPSKVHPVSHPPPRLPPRTRPSEQKEVVLPLNSSPTPNLDSTLIASDSFELDLDVDVTLRAPSDESLSPQVNFSTESSVQVEDASIERDFSKENPFSQPLLRRLSCEPPPVPPKAVARGPPPRPPSRQLVHSNPAFCMTSEDDLSDEDERLDSEAKVDVASLPQQSNYLNLGKEYGEFNISFV